jgi:hypothetical protein
MLILARRLFWPILYKQRHGFCLNAGTFLTARIGVRHFACNIAVIHIAVTARINANNHFLAEVHI